MKQELLFELSKRFLESVRFDAYQSGDTISIKTLKLADELQREILKLEKENDA